MSQRALEGQRDHRASAEKPLSATGKRRSKSSNNRRIRMRAWRIIIQADCGGKALRELRIVDINELKVWAKFWSLDAEQIDGLSAVMQ